jgi:FMN-dependent oxidoreductase (nitrilotriacetate monooxygenase family)
MLGGRAAWNVVTSLNDSEAANFGQPGHLDHDARYDRADEFMEAVLGHWDTWEDGAILQDRALGVFADPTRVHRLDHRGQWFRTRGPFTVPRTPQGRPVVIQAGQSGRGRRFAARWGELIFVIHPDLAAARAGYRQIKDEVARAGRDPGLVTVTPAVYCVVGETMAMAEDKMAYIEGLAHPLDTLVLLSEVLNHDFAVHDADAPLTEAELRSMGGLQALRDRVVQASGTATPTTGDFVRHSRRGTVREFPCFVGTPAAVADGLEEWVTTRACDGFVLAATHIPGAYEDFVRLVVPELQRRGLARRQYPGTTLRETLGLPRAERGDWKAAPGR